MKIRAYDEELEPRMIENMIATCERPEHSCLCHTFAAVDEISGQSRDIDISDSLRQRISLLVHNGETSNAHCTEELLDVVRSADFEED